MYLFSPQDRKISSGTDLKAIASYIQAENFMMLLVVNQPKIAIGPFGLEWNPIRGNISSEV